MKAVLEMNPINEKKKKRRKQDKKEEVKFRKQK